MTCVAHQRLAGTHLVARFAQHFEPDAAVIATEQPEP